MQPVQKELLQWKGAKQYMKAKEVRRLMSDVRRWEEERRHLKTKEAMQKWLKSPNVCTHITINIMNIEWRLQMKKTVKKKIGYAKLYMKFVK